MSCIFLSHRERNCSSPADVFEASGHPILFESLLILPSLDVIPLQAFVGGLYKDQGGIVVRDWLVRLLRSYAADAYAMVRRQHGLPSPVPLPTPTSSPTPSSPSSALSVDLSTLPGDAPPTPVTPSSASPLAVFNQHISQLNQHVEWTYSDGTMNRVEDTLAAVNSEDRQRGVTTPTSTRGRHRRSALEVLMVRSSRSTPVWLASAIVDGECLGTGFGNTKKIARNEAAKQGLEKLGVTLDR